MSGLHEGGNKDWTICSWVSHGYVDASDLHPSLHPHNTALTDDIGLITDLLHRLCDRIILVCQVWGRLKDRAASSFRWNTSHEGSSACSSEDIALLLTAGIIQSIYAIQIFYYLSVFCIKMSIMCLYLRICMPSSSLVISLESWLTPFFTAQALRTWFWKASIATIVLLVAQFFSTILVTLLQCRPIPKYWDQSLPGTCIDINAFFYCKPESSKKLSP